MTTTEEVLAAGALYARAGLRAFPLILRTNAEGKVTKHPPTGYMWADRASDRVSDVVQDLEDACTRYGPEMVGIGWALGRDGCVAVDLDIAEVPDWWHELEASPHAVNITGRGRHLIWRNPDGLTPSNSTVGFPSTEWGEVRGVRGYLAIWGWDRPGFDVAELDRMGKFPRPDWLTAAEDTAPAADPATVEAFLARHTEAVAPRKLDGIRTVLKRWTESTDAERSERDEPVSRHLMLVRTACWVAREAAAGLYPAREGFDVLGDWWAEVMDDPIRRRDGERPTAIAWAIAQAEADPDRIAKLRAEADAEKLGCTRLDEAPSRPTEDVPTADATEADPIAAAVERIRARTLRLTDTVPPPRPLVADVLDLGTLVLLYARWGCFKSFLGIDWALHVATGRPWLGHEVERRPVVILGYEAPLSLHRRAQAWCRFHGVDPADLGDWFHLDRRPRPLTSPTERAAMLTYLDDVDAGLVLVDTVARAAVGLKMNTDESLVLFDALQTLVTDNRTVAGIGHAGKDGSKGARGFSGQEDWADAVFLMERERTAAGPHGPATLHNAKQKDRDPAAPRRFDLAPVDVDGMASAVLVPAESPKAQPRTDPRGLTAAEKAENLVLGYLRSRHLEDWTPVPELVDRCRRTGPRHKPQVTRAEVADAVNRLVELGRLERGDNADVRLVEADDA